MTLGSKHPTSRHRVIDLQAQLLNDPFHTANTDLDPADWEAFAREAHFALDLVIAHLRSLREQKVWQPTPDHIKARFESPLPREGRELSELLDDFAQTILPYGAGNIHPLFLGWVQGAGTPIGMVAEMLAAGLNANCGGRNHIAIDVERQITLWLAELFGFPREASGVFVTGTSLANLLAVLVARRDALGDHVRREGLHESRLTGYTSQEAHGCIAKAFDLAGLGSDYLRQLPVDAEGAMRIDALREAVARDRAAGLTPSIVIGTAGTVNTGAFDSLSALADFCDAEHLWFHIDGAFGALCALSPNLKHLVDGIERADSVALDFHKWLQVPYDAGFLLVRDAEAHRQTFMSSGAYLSRAPRGLAAGDIWPCDLGPDLSRGFRALKTWFTVQAFGSERLGAMIAETCNIARHLGALIETSSTFELSALVRLNIVCFSVKGEAKESGERNRAIVMDLHERGLAAPSITILDGKPVIRAAILNHRTRLSDMAFFLSAATEAAARLAKEEARSTKPDAGQDDVD
ncbi:MAG TPA: pyridoxal-dependent decarboxylase [Methylovirgula sp.]